MPGTGLGTGDPEAKDTVLGLPTLVTSRGTERKAGGHGAGCGTGACPRQSQQIKKAGHPADFRFNMNDDFFFFLV